MKKQIPSIHNAKQSNWWRTIKGALARWAEEDGDQRAAAFAYYLLLSLLPLVFMLVSAGSLFVEREVATREVVQWIERYVPLTGEQERGVVENIQGVLESRGKISLAAFPLLLWSALKFLRTLIRTTNRIWHSPAYSWWRLPLKGLGLLAVILGAALLGVLLPGMARLARGWLATYIEFPGWAFALLFNILPWLVLLCGVIVVYRLAPSRPTKFSEVWIGALVATGLIWACEWLFLLYAINFAQFNVLYGALGGVAALLLWIYLSSCIGVFGICLCAAQAEIQGKGNLTNHSNDTIHEQIKKRWSDLRSSLWCLPSLIVAGSMALAMALIEVNLSVGDQLLAKRPRLFGAGAA